jgi:hypothetical protein
MDSSSQLAPANLRTRQVVAVFWALAIWMLAATPLWA